MSKISQYARSLLKPPEGEYAYGTGRAELEGTYFGSQDPIEQSKGLGYYATMSKSPLLCAGLSYRDISNLWIACQKDGQPYQLLPYDYDLESPEIYDFCAWNFDEALDKPLAQIIYEQQRAALIYGRAISELDWRYDTERKRWYIATIWDRDPERFMINPLGLEPGIYLKSHYFSNIVSADERLPDKKFCVTINNFEFENFYGESEFASLVGAEYGYRHVIEFLEKHLENNGTPQKILKYPKSREGAHNQAWRDNQLEAVRRAGNNSIIQISEDNLMETLPAEGDADSFELYLRTRAQEISLVLTGSTTALSEGKYGSYSKEESTTVRQKSQKEQKDCEMIQSAWNYQIIPWLIDFNFQGVSGYPRMQIIPEEIIGATTPENQDTEEDLNDAAATMSTE